MRCVSPVRLWGLPGVWGLLFCALGMAFLGAGRTEAAYFVREDGRGDGTSWENAGNLQSMLNAASADFGRDPAQRPVDVHVAAGAYKGTTLVLPRGVKLWGGYPATLEGTSVAGRDRKANVTILDGEGKRRVVACLGNGAQPGDTRLDGFTVTRGHDDFGGGMVLGGSSPTVADCTFSENTVWNGGGMALWKSSPMVERCTFLGNTASSNGGGISLYESAPTLANCTFSGNTASYGGGISLYESAPTVVNCTLSDNAADNGGGMLLRNSSPTVVNTILWGNGADTEGAALFLYNLSVRPPVLRNCVMPLGGIASGDGNAVGVDSADLIGEDPKLVPCDAEGAETHDPSKIRFYALGTGSSALGRGQPVGSRILGDSGNARTVVVPSNDQRGYVRPQGGNTDIGSWQGNDPEPDRR